ncbi:MAG TPA: hypothetical protein VHW02_15710 [Rhizomicrobium sp.]|nr:hypothetical protein [Rhizomicrobium sp.]
MREAERIPSARIAYEQAEALIYDPIAANRTGTRSALYALGFRRIDTAVTLEAFADALRKHPPDIAIAEAQGVEAELSELIQSVRRGTGGLNPFVVMIITAWSNDNTLVGRVINSGADDLLLRPFSTTLLGQRIRGHIERRKGFVITSDYVGPDRRRDTARASNVELHEPPNSLKMKALDRLSADETAKRLDIELSAARETFAAEKLRRDAFQVCILWRLLQDRTPGTPPYLADMRKLKLLTKDVSARCAGTVREAAVEHCESIVAAVEALELGTDRNATMHLLGHAAMSLKQAFEPEKSEIEHREEIDTTVATINARQAPAMAS